MTHKHHPIAVKHLPQSLTSRQERCFLLELEPYLRADRPRIVLDCSALLQMDRAAIQLLMCCLEEAMKRNGDVKLAALSDLSAAVLDRTGVLHLFECYQSTAEAVSSFRRLPVGASNTVTGAEAAEYRSEAAAQVA